MKRIRLVILAAVLAAGSAALAENMSLAPGTNIRRTMSLLGNSTPDHPNTVRLLFYGQSISEQVWHLEVDADLRARFPSANIIMENRARGGCASDCLVGYVDDDVFTFNPDLVIFHVYGANAQYEQIIIMMRNHVNPDGSKPEVLIHNDHYTGTDAWSDLMSWNYVPGIANTYKCGFIDVRTPWIDAVNANCGGDPHCYLSDDVHLNEAGNALLASMIKPYLIHDPNWLPTRATNLGPANWATGVSINANLSWTAGIDADSHDLYFGTTTTPPFIQNQPGTTFDPGTMEPNKIYYWRIDPRNENGSTAGLTTQFTTGTGRGTGLLAEHFDNADLTNLKAVWTDAVIDCNWRSYSPDPCIGADTFSVRWTGQVEPVYSETYTFYTKTDDGARLWVDGNQIVNKWQNQTATEWSGTAVLTAGRKYDIKMEYYDNTGDALAQLRWSSASQAKQIIPQARLYKYPQVGDLDNDYEIDLADVQLFCGQWMTDPLGDPNNADFDDSNNVDFYDFALMGTNWMR